MKKKTIPVGRQLLFHDHVACKLVTEHGEVVVLLEQFFVLKIVFVVGKHLIG